VAFDVMMYDEDANLKRTSANVHAADMPSSTRHRSRRAGKAWMKPGDRSLTRYSQKEFLH
jgi:hypothetical protein